MNILIPTFLFLGDLPPGVSIADVSLAASTDQLTTNFPAIICSFFPNVRFLGSMGSRISLLSSVALTNCPNLVMFAAANEQISRIPEDFFRSNSELTSVLFVLNQIEEIPARLFENTPKIEEINFSQNRITNLPAGVFRYLPFLNDLRLTGNQLTTINSDAFRSTNNLVGLRLQQNRIAAIDPEFFDSQWNLNELFLSGNLCNSMNFNNVRANREQTRGALQECFDNFKSSDPPGDDDGSYIRCVFDQTIIPPDGFSVCELEIYNPNGRDDFERIEGELFLGVDWI
jgi:Leucine-rich repeat (LRR) protein